MKFSMDGPNDRIELTHQETDDLLKAFPGGVGAVTAALAGFGVPAIAVGVVGAALAAHIAWEGAAIKAADKGQGVFLTSPMVPSGPIGLLVIPSTRYEFDNETGRRNTTTSSAPPRATSSRPTSTTTEIRRPSSSG
jgi:hypothetical protein